MRGLTDDERLIIGQLHDAGKGPIEIVRVLDLRRTQIDDYHLLTYVIDELRQRGVNLTK